MAKIPSFQELGLDAPKASTDVASYQATSGHETAPGEALAAMGTSVENEGDKLWAVARQEQEKVDTTKVEDAWNKYKSTALDLTNGPNGVLATQGADAVNGKLLDKTTTGLTDARKAILESLQTDEQRTRFAQRADITDLSTKHQVLTHLVSQQKAYASSTMNDSAAIAQSEVAKDPSDDATFIRSQGQMLGQADAYLKSIGSDNAKANDVYKAKLTDSLWNSRIESLLSMNLPLQADALFRANAGQITDPVMRMTLRNKTQEGAVVMNASLRAETEVSGAISKLVESAVNPPQGRTTPEGGPSAGGTVQTGWTCKVFRNLC